MLDPLTRMAAVATLHCLTGCAIGEVLGLGLGTWWGLSNGATIALAVGLAFVFGYAFTVGPVLRTGVGLRRALGLALAADTVSIATMEIVDNGVMLAVPGAMDATLGDLLFWGALTLSLVTAFVLTVPVNRWLIARGRGHAVVHGAHGGHNAHSADHKGHGPGRDEHADHAKHAGHDHAAVAAAAESRIDDLHAEHAHHAAHLR